MLVHPLRSGLAITTLDKTAMSDWEDWLWTPPYSPFYNYTCA